MEEYYRGTEVMLNMIPKVKFELVVDDGGVGPLVDLHPRDGAKPGKWATVRYSSSPWKTSSRIPHRGTGEGCRVEDAGLTAPTSQCVTAP